MKTVSRWLAVVIGVMVVTQAWAGTAPREPAKPAPTKPAAAPAKPTAAKGTPAKPAAPGRPLRLINLDLQGRKGPLPANEYQEIKAVIVYLEPDILVLHNVLRSAGESAGKPLPKLTSSLEMYYAFQPLTDTVGSALITRHPISQATYLADASGAAVGMQMTVRPSKGESYSVLVVRPPNLATSKAATGVVVSALKQDPGAQYLLLASFSPETSVTGAVKAWSKAGLFDPGARLGKMSATYPGEKPKERLDVIMLSAGLREGAKCRVVRDPRYGKLSAHLPVEVTLSP